MSLVAEFAARLCEEGGNAVPRHYAPAEYPSRVDKLHDIHAVVFDVYGTLIDYWKPPFATAEGKELELLAAFRKTVERFGFTSALAAMNPADAPEKTLYDLYNGLIALDLEKSRGAGSEYPEIRIERIWSILIMMMQRHGYDPAAAHTGDATETARCASYCYNFHALGSALYPGVVDALERLKADNLRLGIVSNAQFYTPMDLTLQVRRQSGGRYDDYAELIDHDLTFYSYEYGHAKPGKFLFEKLYNALYESHILPAQVVFVGNDLSQDIRVASEIGMKTAFFCGDRNSAFTHDLAGVVVPDLAFTDFGMLPRMISFHDERKEEK